MKQTEIRKITQKILPILRKNHISKAGIFGSYAKGEQNEKSDIDILIKVPRGIKFSLLDFVGLKIALEKKLKKKVDLLTYQSIHPLLKENILGEEIKVL